MAWYNLRPDPAEVTMHLMAQLLALFANVYRDTRSARTYKPSDFLPSPKPVNDHEAIQRWNEVIREMREQYMARKGLN